MRRKGFTVSLADCFIAVSTAEADAELFTLDSHCEAIRPFLKFSVYTPAANTLAKIPTTPFIRIQPRPFRNNNFS